MYKPTPEHSLRASYNRAFRAPSVINQYLDQSIFSPSAVDLRPLAALLPPEQRGLVPDEPFLLVVRTTGQPDLREENVDALELVYTGTFGERTTVGPGGLPERHRRQHQLRVPSRPTASIRRACRASRSTRRATLRAASAP